MIFLIFWFVFILICYHYVGYPLYLMALYFFKKDTVIKNEIYPFVDLVIAAYNEEKVIEQKIKNSLELDYPTEKLNIIIVSDGSTDTTHQIVQKYENARLIGMFHPLRRGKTAALNRALDSATGQIVVFSDANSMFDSNAVKMLVRNFNDSVVGGVCGRKSIVSNEARESSRGDGLFWDFESSLKNMQSHVDSISTGDGEIFAVRRELYEEIPEFIINDDTAITLNIIEKGYRVIYEPEAVSREEASSIIEDDFNVKARMVSGGYQTMKQYSRMFFPPRNLFSVQFLSHKLLRWVMPYLLIILFISSFILDGVFYCFFFWLQFLFYIMALMGYVLRNKNIDTGILYYPLYYCTMNFAAALGLVYFLRRDNINRIWKKAAR